MSPTASQTGRWPASKLGNALKSGWSRRDFTQFWVITLRHHMMTSSNRNIFRVTGPLCGEFTGPGEFPAQRPVTRNFDVFFDLRLNKRLSKQPRGWWFDALSWSLWRHRNDSNLRVHSNLNDTTQFCSNLSDWTVTRHWFYMYLKKRQSVQK